MTNPDDNNDIDFEAMAAEDAAYSSAHDPEAEEAQDPADADEDFAEEGPDYKAVIQALQAELEQTKDQALRATAEAQNTRRRAQKDKEDASKFGVTKMARDLLSVADNLRRALDAMPEGADANMIKGIEATERELLGAFERNGIQKLEPLHLPFDPNQHEVMFETPSEGHPAGTVTQIMEPGYALNGRILRPARVGVAKDEGQGSADDQGKPGGQVNLDA